MKYLITLLLFLAIPVFAQTPPTLTLTSTQVTKSDGTVTPTLTWASAPSASLCTASGATGWEGTKAPSGTQVLPDLSISATFTLVCQWSSKNSIDVSWVPATTHVDNTPYADAAGYKVYWGSASDAENFSSGVAGVGITTFTIQPLTPGTYSVSVTSVNNQGGESSHSNSVTKAIAPTSTVTKSLAVTVNPKPNPPTNVTVK